MFPQVLFQTLVPPVIIYFSITGGYLKLYGELMADAEIKVGDIVEVHYKKGYFIVEALKEEKVYGGGVRDVVAVRNIMGDYGQTINGKVINDYRLSMVVKITEESLALSRKHDNEKWDRILIHVNPEAEVCSGVLPEEGVITNQPEPKFLSDLEIPKSLLEKK